MMTIRLLSAVTAVAIAVTPFAVVADELTHDAQVALKALGYMRGSADGNFGTKTAEALSAFCDDNNLPSDGTLDVHDLIELQYAAREKVSIPLLIKYDISPDSRGLVLTDLSNHTYSQCKASFNFAKMGRERDASAISKRYDGFFESDLYPNYVGRETDQDGGSVTEGIADTIFNLHHHCLAGDTAACKAIVKLADLAAKNGSYVLSFDPNQNGASSEVFFYTKQRILTPLLVAYATAIQVVGKPKTHEEIGKWAYSAILQNTFDPFLMPDVQRANRDFFRTKSREPEQASGCRDLRAGGHSLASGYLAGLHGAIWNNKHMFQLALDAVQFALGDIDENGAITCSANRGANALFYSGGELSTMLQVFQLAKLNGIDPMAIKNAENVHRAADFILDAAFDDTLLEGYAKKNFLAWCGDDYRHQCIDWSPGRIAAFGWIPLYLKLFPDANASRRFYELATDMETSTTLSDDQKWALTAIMRSNYPTEKIKHNFANVKAEGWDNVSVVYSDVQTANLGSPYCLYGYSDKN